MKLRTIAQALTIVLWLFFLIPWKGKEVAPELFGSSAVQWTSAIIVAILIPVVVLMALSMIFRSADRKVGFGLFVGACLPLIGSLIMYGIGGTMLARANLMLQGGHKRDSELIAKLTERAISGDTQEERSKSGGILYSMFGVQSVWKNGEGDLERYYPTVEQEEEWEDTIDTEKVITDSTAMVDWHLKQMPWLFGLYLGSFCVIIFAGLAWRTYKQQSEQDAAGNPLPL